MQPTRDSLTFIIYTGKGNVKLEACLSAQSARLSLTDGETAVPAVAPNFCMLLRKHLQNAEILDIVQPDFERIIYFDLKCTSEFTVAQMRLYFEIMGKYSNAVLCENGVIVGAENHRDKRKHQARFIRRSEVRTARAAGQAAA